MKIRPLLAVSFIIIILLTGALFYPGALTKPYSGYSEPYTIAHESSEAFNETIQEQFLNPEAATSVEELSEGEQNLFQEAKDQSPSQSEYGPSGWQYAGEPVVCDDSLFICDEYEEMPGTNDSSTEYNIVEDSNGEVYLVRVGHWGDQSWDLEEAIEFLTKILSSGLYALFLAYRAGSSSPPRPTPTSVGYGAVLVVLVFAYPYFLMFTAISLPSWHLPALVAITWAVILAEIWRGRIETRSASSQVSD